MVKLCAPDTAASFTIEGVQYSAAESADGTIDIPERLVAAAKSHGFSDFVDEDAGQPDDEFAAMKRNALFAWLKERGVRVVTPIDYAGLRRLCRDKVAEIEAAASAVAGEGSQEPQDARHAAGAPSAPETLPTAAGGAAIQPSGPSALEIGAAARAVATPELIEPVNAPLDVVDNPGPVPAP